MSLDNIQWLADREGWAWLAERDGELQMNAAARQLVGPLVGNESFDSVAARLADLSVAAVSAAGDRTELAGRDASCHRQWWSELYLQRHHTGLNGPAIQGVSSPEVAAWDLMARAADVPLWMLLGGRCRERVLCYDTNSGWLGYTLDELTENMKRSVDEGFRGVKIKIGSADFGEDLRRLEAVRTALGDDIMIATDVNNRWDLQRALQCAPALADFGVAWLEEPLYPFDVPGHAELASSIDTPLLHGENLYEPLMVRDMLDAGAP